MFVFGSLQHLRSKSMRIHKMGKILAISAALLFSSGAVVQTYNREHLKAVVNQWQHKLDKARLMGAGPKEMIDYLNRQKLNHGKYDRTPHPGMNVKLGGVIYGQIDNVARTFTLADGPQVWDVVISFQFDNKNKLVGYAVRTKPVGL